MCRNTIAALEAATGSGLFLLIQADMRKAARRLTQAPCLRGNSMQCFNHHGTAAVGMCKHCCKGLCTACATDLGHGLACHDLHETQVTSTHALVTKATRLQAVNRSNKYLGPAFFIVMGGVFAIWGFATERSVANFTFALGVLFVLYGAFVLRAVLKTYAQPET